MTKFNRDYDSILKTLNEVETPDSRNEWMQVVVDLLWDALADQGVSWVGFYLDSPQPGSDGEQCLILGPRRDKPACSPIGMHGVCGNSYLSRKTYIVKDIRELGENYIACDRKDQSEIVIPIVDENDECYGVLDLDSYEAGAFNEVDDVGLRRVLRAVGFIAG